MLLVKYFVKKQKIVDNYELTLLASFPNPAKMCSTTCVNMFLSSGQSHLFLMVNFLLFPFWTYTSDPIPLACPENFLKTHHQKFHDVMTPQIKAQPCLSSKRVWYNGQRCNHYSKHRNFICSWNNKTSQQIKTIWIQCNFFFLVSYTQTPNGF